MSTLAERVEAGAAWLDVQEPGWRDTIDLAKLRLFDCKACICGQVFETAARNDPRILLNSGYHHALRLAHGGETASDGTWSYSHGFYAIEPGSTLTDKQEAGQWKRLAGEWRRFIREGKRQAKRNEKRLAHA